MPTDAVGIEAPLRSLMSVYANRIRPDWPSAKPDPQDFRARLCERDYNGAEMTASVTLTRPAAVSLCAMLVSWIANKGAMPELVAQMDPLTLDSFAWVLRQHNADAAALADRADAQAKLAAEEKL